MTRTGTTRRPLSAVPPAVALFALLALPPVAVAQQTPAGELDESWARVCAGATPGSAFFDRCQEILNAGPGSGGRRSAAALGNNLGVASAQSRTARASGSEQSEEQVRYETEVGGWSFYLNAGYEDGDRDGSDFEAGFGSEMAAFAVGFDKTSAGGSTFGVAANWSDTGVDFDGGAGDLDQSSIGFTLYGSFAAGENGYVSVYAGGSSLDYDNTRAVSYELNTGVSVTDVAVGSTDGDQIVAGIALGWDRPGSGWTVSPEIAADLVETDIDAYTETGGAGLALAWGDQRHTSLTSRVGVGVAKTVSRNWGVLRPEFSLSWVHEFDDDARTIPTRFAGDANGEILAINTEEPDRDYFLAGFGFSTVHSTGRQFFVHVDAMIGHSFLSGVTASFGLRWGK